ncbi:pyridoxal-dependent decarboxylase domain protein, partial [Teladorsagia circumcincta]
MMDPESFRKYGKQMIDYVADYWRTIRDRSPLPDVQPGFLKHILRELLVLVASPETFNLTLEFVPQMFDRIQVADCDGHGSKGMLLSWNHLMSGPSLTELEMTTLDWLVDLLGLPEHFKNFHPGIGSSLIQTNSGEATTTAIITARATVVEVDEEGAGIRNAEYHDPVVFERLIAYCSEQAHPLMEKALMLHAVRLRKLKCDIDPEMKNYTVTKETLERAIKEDRAHGLIPFLMIATMGTKKTCSFDRLDELGPVCYRERIYLHVDAAYG